MEEQRLTMIGAVGMRKISRLFSNGLRYSRIRLLAELDWKDIHTGMMKKLCRYGRTNGIGVQS